MKIIEEVSKTLVCENENDAEELLDAVYQYLEYGGEFGRYSKVSRYDLERIVEKAVQIIRSVEDILKEEYK